MSTEPAPQLDPELLVARIIAELQANPEAQPLLLRAMLTNEFLGMPARLDRIEKDVAELKVDVAHLKADMVEVKADIAELKTDMVDVKADIAELKTDMADVKSGVAYLIGSDLEVKLHRRARARLSQDLQLRRSEIMQSQLLEPVPELARPVDIAYQNGVITPEQDARITETDFVLRARRRDDPATVWVAVEVSATVDAHDMQRARETADALAAVFGTDTIAVVAGYWIDPRDQERADAADVVYVKVPADQLSERIFGSSTSSQPQ
ncbi:MAG: hypothetical protein OXE87_00925 [Chloroflexi bacterium]|nr:hypothetical protein [Chloroflexota bacterium]